MDNPSPISLQQALGVLKEHGLVAKASTTYRLVRLKSPEGRSIRRNGRYCEAGGCPLQTLNAFGKRVHGAPAGGLWAWGISEYTRKSDGARIRRPMRLCKVCAKAWAEARGLSVTRR